MPTPEIVAEVLDERWAGVGFWVLLFFPLTWMFGLDFSRKRKSRTRSV